jgi:hypothetical protein
MYKRIASLVVVLSMVVGAPLACSAGNDKDPANSLTNTDGGGGLLGEGGLNGEAGGDDAACAAATYTGKKIPASLLILLDRSGSMSKDGKWAAAVSALQKALASADNDLPVGLLFFPEGKWSLGGCALTPNDPACASVYADSGCKDIKTTPDVPVDILTKTRAAITGKLTSTSPNGDTTPTRWGLKNSWAYMQKLSAKADRFVVLVTDGEPTVYSPKTTVGGFSIPESAIECKDQMTIEAEALAASSGMPPVKTFVIGAPGSEKASPHLSRIAVNGKTRRTPTCDPTKGECHYQIGSGSFETDLEKALNDITGKIATCIFEVPTGTDVDPNRVNVSVDATDAYRDETHADGWDYTDGTKTRIEIHGPLCDQIKKNPSTVVVKIVLGCVTRVR